MFIQSIKTHLTVLLYETSRHSLCLFPFDLSFRKQRLELEFYKSIKLLFDPTPAAEIYYDFSYDYNMRHVYYRQYWKHRVSEVAQSCPTLCDPIDCSLPGSSVHGIFQAIVLEWIAISFSRGSSWPRDWTWVSCIVDRRFTPPGKLKKQKYYYFQVLELQLGIIKINCNSRTWK